MKIIHQKISDFDICEKSDFFLDFLDFFLYLLSRFGYIFSCRFTRFLSEPFGIVLLGFLDFDMCLLTDLLTGLSRNNEDIRDEGRCAGHVEIAWEWRRGNVALEKARLSGWGIVRMCDFAFFMWIWHWSFLFEIA